MPEQSIRLSGLEDRAVKERFDLAAHRSELHASLEELGFEKDFRLVEEMGLAISGEREPGGEWLIGPTLEIPLPIFDQGQARVSAATLAVRGMRDRLLAEERQVRSDVILESEALSLSRTRATHLGAVVLPLREDVVRLTLAEYNYMLEGPFHLLEAQQETNETYRQYVIALTDYWIARVKLRAAIGGGAFEAKLGDVS
jgi:cobalt-zinc-cadmium efflux system outer membrane protein